MAKQLSILIGIVFVLVGCIGQPAEDLVARWQGGSLSRTDLESFIIGLPLPEDRIVDEKDPGAWWREQAEEAILGRLLVEAADPAVRDGLEAALRDELRVLVAESEILKRLGPIVEPSEESLESAWVELESTLKSPERRQLLNIFRRATDPSAQKIALDELEDLRRRVMAGESFGTIAEAFSDSESRHRRGMVGVFERGQLDPGLEEIVFSLTPDIPSEPVSTDDGVHLFLVRSVFPERSLRYEESRPELVRHVLAEKHRTRLEETARELWQPMESDVILDPDELERVLRSTENGIVLGVGSFEVNRNEWLRRSRSNSGASVNQEFSHDGYLNLARQEMILQGVETTTGVDKGIAKGFEAIEDRLIADGQLEIELRRAVTDDEILTYYSTNSSRFATAPRSHLQRLEVPIEDNPVAVMGRLEQARVELNRGGLDLVDLARELGGEVDDLGWLDRPGLARVIPSSPTSILAVPAGEFGSPFTTSYSLVLLEVVDVETPRIPSLDEIRLKVVARYVVEERPRLEKRVRETMLLDAEVEFEPSWLESFIPSGEKSPTG